MRLRGHARHRSWSPSSASHATEIPAVSHEVTTSIRRHPREPRACFGTLKLFVRAYSLGGGTYTGIEAVSNGVGIMREPRVQTAKRTMVMMALSLAITAGGILLCYLLLHVQPDPEGKTMNAVLFESFADAWTVGGLHVGHAFVWIALLSEGALLFVAAQTGFVDGPRVMANMAIDSWLPHRFSAALRAAHHAQRRAAHGRRLHRRAALHERRPLAYPKATGADVSKLVVMYSINVFLTFSLSELGMSKFWIQHRAEHAEEWKRHLPVHLTGLTLCVTILAVTVAEKFGEGGWLTLVITGLLFFACQLIKRHYLSVRANLKRLDEILAVLPSPAGKPEIALDKTAPTAAILVSGFSGLGVHIVLNIQRVFPGYFKNFVFISVGVLDSATFKGVEEVERVKKQTDDSLAKYVELCRGLGVAASARTTWARSPSRQPPASRCRWRASSRGWCSSAASSSSSRSAGTSGCSTTRPPTPSSAGCSSPGSRPWCCPSACSRSGRRARRRRVAACTARPCPLHDRALADAGTGPAIGPWRGRCNSRLPTQTGDRHADPQAAAASLAHQRARPAPPLLSPPAPHVERRGSLGPLLAAAGVVPRRG